MSVSKTVGGFVSETCNTAESPSGATFRLRRQGKPNNLEYYVDVDEGRNQIILCKDEPHEVARFWNDLIEDL